MQIRTREGSAVSGPPALRPIGQILGVQAVITYECWPTRQTGGQVVGTGPSGVKGTHPSGVMACCELHRSQFKNRQAVQEMIEWALLGAGIKDDSL